MTEEADQEAAVPELTLEQKKEILAYLGGCPANQVYQLIGYLLAVIPEDGA